MFGIKFVKFEPSNYVIRRRGKVTVDEGAGLSFFCLLRNTTATVMPVGNIDAPFVFEEVTSDFRTVTLQGQAIFRIKDFDKAEKAFDFTYNLSNLSYNENGCAKLSKRITDSVRAAAKEFVAKLDLIEAVRASKSLSENVTAALKESGAIGRIGIEIIDILFLDVRSDKDTARALEAQAREALLKAADEAVYERRNFAIDMERKVKENEFNTEIAVETKRREVEETKIEAERVISEKKNILLDQEQKSQINRRYEQTMANAKQYLDDNKLRIEAERIRAEKLKLLVPNERAMAENEVWKVTEIIKAFGVADGKVAEAFALSGVAADKLTAKSLADIAKTAGSIGQINISPDLFGELLNKK
jgi:hypothetical protein